MHFVQNHYIVSQYYSGWKTNMERLERIPGQTNLDGQPFPPNGGGVTRMPLNCSENPTFDERGNRPRNNDSDLRIVLERIQLHFSEIRGRACSITEFREMHEQLYTATLNSWNRRLGTASSTDSARDISPAQRRMLDSICAKNHQLFDQRLATAPQQLEFGRISKKDSGLNSSYYVFIDTRSGQRPQRIIESVRHPKAKEYLEAFEQLKGFSPTLWRSFLAHTINPAERRGGELGTGGCSTVKLGYELGKSDLAPKLVAIRQQKPAVDNHAHVHSVVRPQVAHRSTSSLIESSEYFPTMNSGQRTKHVGASIERFNNYPNRLPALEAGFTDRPNYYSVSTLGFSSLDDVIDQCDLSRSVFAPNAAPADLRDFTDKLLKLMILNVEHPLSGRSSTAEQNRFSAAKFVHYMRTNAVDRMSNVVVNLAKQSSALVLNLHQQGKCHGDIKPSNCMLVPDSSSQYSNNLILKLADIDSLSTIDSAARVITPTYSAPSEDDSYSQPCAALRNDLHAVGMSLLELVKGLDSLNQFRSSFVTKQTSKQDLATIKLWNQVSKNITLIGDQLTQGYKTVNSRTIANSFARLIEHKHNWTQAYNARPKKTRHLPTQAEISITRKFGDSIRDIVVTHGLKDNRSVVSNLDRIIQSPSLLCKSQSIDILKMLGVTDAMGQQYIDELINISRDIAADKIEGKATIHGELEAKLANLQALELVGPLQYANQTLTRIEASVQRNSSDIGLYPGNAKPSLADFNYLGLFALSSFDAANPNPSNRKDIGSRFAELTITSDIIKVFKATFTSSLETTPLAQGRAYSRQANGVAIDLRNCEQLNKAEKNIYKQIFNKRPSSTWYSLREDANSFNYLVALGKNLFTSSAKS